MYDSVEKKEHKKFPEALFVSESVYVLYDAKKGKYLHVEWQCDPVNDMLADSIVSLILQIEVNPATHTLMESCCPNAMDQAQTICCFLRRHFNEVHLDERSRVITIDLEGGAKATINLKSKEIQCEDADYRKRIEEILQSVRAATEPF